MFLCVIPNVPQCDCLILLLLQTLMSVQRSMVAVLMIASTPMAAITAHVQRDTTSLLMAMLATVQILYVCTHTCIPTYRHTYIHTHSIFIYVHP